MTSYSTTPCEVVKNLPFADAVQSQTRLQQSSLIPEYLTPRQAANMTGFSLRALEALRAKRNGPSYIKVGRAKNGPIRYHIEDVRAWMQKHREVTHVA